MQKALRIRAARVSPCDPPQTETTLSIFLTIKSSAKAPTLAGSRTLREASSLTWLRVLVRVNALELRVERRLLSWEGG
jgi:hypothetical protein